jgi:hypothetical protein
MWWRGTVEAVLGVGAYIVKKIIGLLPGRVRADESLAAIIVKRRFDRFFPQLHHRTVSFIVTILGKGSLIDHDPMISMSSTRNGIFQRPKIKTAAGNESHHGKAL